MDILELLPDDSYGLDSDSIHIMESLITYIKENGELADIIIEPVDAERYKGDLSGLLSNVYNIPSSALYFNIRLNGFKSTLDYNGERKLKIVNGSTLSTLMDTMDTQKTLKEDLTK